LTGIDWNDLPHEDGVYRSRTFGPPGQQLQVILLDTRYSRSPFQATNDKAAPYTPILDDDVPQQMLSERQWAWLAQELEQPADLRVIVSSIQVMNDVCVFESWRMLPKERQRLYDLIFDRVNVLLLSGDRHVGAFLESEDGGTPEVTASSWTHTIPFGAYGSNCTTSDECDEPDPRRIGSLIRENHFGTLEIDWNTREYVVALRRAETTYGTMYHHKWDSDAGQVIRSRNYTISSFPFRT
jgi:alkaline phosphatase D